MPCVRRALTSGVMWTAMRETIPDSKPQVVQLLELLASADRQLTYEEATPDADISAEFFWMWYDKRIAGASVCSLKPSSEVPLTFWEIATDYRA